MCYHRSMRMLLLGLVACAAIAAASVPARAAYLFLDTNGDGTNRCLDPTAPVDQLTPGVRNVDVYLSTNRAIDGAVLECGFHEEGYAFPLSLVSFEFILRASGPGSVRYEDWTDATRFSGGLIPLGDFTMAARGSDVWVGRYSWNALAPGTYHLGTLSVEVSGYPRLDFAIRTPMADPGAETYFASNCLTTIRVDNVHRLGEDFHDACGTALADPGEVDVWGRIQRLYR